MEVLRDAGIEDSLESFASPARDMLHTSWLHSLNGEEYGRLWAWGNRPDRIGEYEMASPCAMSDLPQSMLEPVLVEEATKTGAKFRFHTEFLAQELIPDGRVKTTLRHRGSDQTYSVLSRYLIGADGARSPVVTSLGIPIDGKQLNTAFNVHIKADLTRFIEHRPGSLNWILNPEAPGWSAVGNIRMVRPWSEFVVSMHPSLKDGTEYEPTNKDILTRLHQMIGDDSVPIEILSSFRWTINDQVARTYQKGPVICIGDAVHRHPPINGLGSNTCISDAMNIAWKLAYVLKGISHPQILETITTERKPVGDGVVRRANEGMQSHRALWDVIGLSSEKRKATTAIMAQPTQEGEQLRAAFRQALEATDDELNALGIQMNQRYLDSSLTYAEPDDVAPDLATMNLIKQQIISTFPGHHLPHAWVAKDSQSKRKSTLDLCGKGEYTLLTGIGGEAWRDAAAAVMAQRSGLVINVISIGWRQDYMDAYRDWQKIRGVEDSGAVLIRPDNFVAWRCFSMATTAEDKLKSVFDRILTIVQGTN